MDWILTLAAITVLGGFFLYWHDWHLFGSFSDWRRSRFGDVLTIGALAALAAFGIGIFGTRPTVGRFFALGDQVAASGAPPTPEVAAQTVALQSRLKNLARISLGLLVIAVLGMSIARYV